MNNINFEKKNFKYLFNLNLKIFSSNFYLYTLLNKNYSFEMSITKFKILLIKLYKIK